MKVRTSTIRNRLFALVAVPLAGLLVLWAVGMYLTFPEGQRLYQVSTLVDHVAKPMENVLLALQDERRASMVYRADPSTANATELSGIRARVNARITAARAALDRGDVHRAASGDLMRLADIELSRLSNLPDLRSKVDHRFISPGTLMDSYGIMTDGLTPLYAAIVDFPDATVATKGRSVRELSRAREMLSRQDAVLANALATGHFTTATYRLFLQANAVARFSLNDMRQGLSGDFAREYDAITTSTPFPQLEQLENTAAQQGRVDQPVPVDSATWDSVNAGALGKLHVLEFHRADAIDREARAPAYTIFIRLGVVTLVGLLATVVAVLVARRIARGLVRQLRGLRDTARDLAWVRLPSVVDQLRDGQHVDVATEVPRLSAGTDEIGQVSEAFNEVGRTAVQAAAEQSALRAGVASVFLNIARRSQVLVNSQLRQLDVMERKAVEPEGLEDLFTVDHLATRMRRNAENLVILGGGAPGRVFREPVPLLDVLRSAASEAEDYERVRVRPFPPVMMAGSVVSDVVHLCAELIDNATSFSPPHTKVYVTGQSVPKGFAVEIEDRGLGMQPDVLQAANRWLEQPPEFDVLALSDDARLGMFVVGRIAARHHIRVHLRNSPYGGTTAIVLLPAELVAGSGETDELRRRDADRTEVPPADEPAGLPAAGTGATQELEPVLSSRIAALSDTAAPTAPTSPAGSSPAGSPAPTSPAPAAPVLPPAPARGAGAHRAPADGPLAPQLPERTRRPDSPAPEPRPSEPRPSESRPTEPPPFEPGRPEPRRPPEPVEPVPVSAGTHKGLPKRVRQASLAPGLRAGPPTDPVLGEAPAAAPARSPEEVRRMMSAYQSGTVRGRAAVDTTDADPTRDGPTSPWATVDPPRQPDPVPVAPAGSAGPAERDRDSRPQLPVRDRSGGWRASPIGSRQDDLDKTTELTAIDVDREDD